MEVVVVDDDVVVVCLADVLALDFEDQGGVGRDIWGSS